jgi:hypothetical protein
MVGESVGSGVRAVISVANVTEMGLFPWSWCGDTARTRTGFAEMGFGELGAFAPVWWPAELRPPPHPARTIMPAKATTAGPVLVRGPRIGGLRLSLS